MNLRVFFPKICNLTHPTLCNKRVYRLFMKETTKAYSGKVENGVDIRGSV